jgi:glycerol-1-phosphate dehydrogenase [NAD(P)+]
MEFHGSSRPASGADHQIAHLWEMADLHHGGERVAHGAAVAVGCVDALALFDWLLARDLAALEADRIVARAPDADAKTAAIAAAFPDPTIAARAREETLAKHLAPGAHRARLHTLRAAWPALRATLEGRLMRAEAMRALLRAAGAPTGAADIGVAPAEHRRTVAASRFLRSRYTVLDLLDECGLLEAALDDVFAPSGILAA